MVSKLEEKFFSLWQSNYPELILEKEVRLIPSRRFRFDFVHLPTKIAIEINGGTWSNGRHNRGSALPNEYTKINLANIAGYQVFFLSTGMVNQEWVNLIGNYILQKQTIYIYR